MKLYISDLDGTLLNEHKKISIHSKNLINDAIKFGANFSIATARTPGTIVNILDGINISIPVVIMNGAAIYNIKLNNYIHYTLLDNSIIDKLVYSINKHNIKAFIYTIKDNFLYVYYDDLSLSFQLEFFNARKDSKYKKFIKSSLPENSNVLYFTMMDYKSKIDSLYNEIKDIPNISIAKYRDVYNDKVYILEIYDASCSKANAINYLKYKYKFDKIICFGDNSNDIPMFEISDESYAVENSVDELKKKATKIIGSNNSDSVAKYIYEDIKKTLAKS